MPQIQEMKTRTWPRATSFPERAEFIPPASATLAALQSRRKQGVSTPERVQRASGHGFIPGIKAPEQASASAPEARFSPVSPMKGSGTTLTNPHFRKTWSLQAPERQYVTIPASAAGHGPTRIPPACRRARTHLPSISVLAIRRMLGVSQVVNWQR
jgi:hypothetical protein